MKVDLKGRLSKIKLSKKNALLPVYEAVVNSFQAILEKKDNSKENKITIEAVRDYDQLGLDSETVHEIIGFKITDTGIGFDERNYKSFTTSDSQYKIEIGGKGIGRFIWLKTFDEIEVESIFNEENSCKVRKFKFTLEDEPIVGHTVADIVGPKEIETKIELVNIKKDYQENIPNDLNKIGIKIIEHCLVFFMEEDCPNVIIKDEHNEINLNEKFKLIWANNMKEETFKIKGRDFKIVHAKLYETEGNKNRIHFCANEREVKNENLKKLIVDLGSKIKDKDKDKDREFIYSGYVYSNVLDDVVNDERTDFIFDLVTTENGNEYISKNDIETSVKEHIERYLEEYLTPITKDKIEKINKYVSEKNPSYKPLLKYKQAEIKKIGPNLSESEIDIELYKIQQQFKVEVKKQGEEFLNANKIKDIKDIKEYKKNYTEYIEKENVLGKSALAEYIIHRKLVIDLLENALKKGANDKYKLEEYIHNMIFPMHVTSDDIDYEKHNLWLIDEKLSYHYYLASDITMKKTENINVNTNDRMDLLIMDKPIVTTGTEDKPYSALTIIEFKRPMRDDYTSDNNPIEQVYKYARAIRRGNKNDKDGRPIKVTDSSPFYLYIIADLTEKLEEQAENLQLKKTPDGLGYFGYNATNSLNAYVEVISYEKILMDAKSKNRILFDKLFK